MRDHTSLQDAAYRHKIERAGIYLANGHLRRAISLLDTLHDSPIRDYLLAKALVNWGGAQQQRSQEWAPRARAILESLLFSRDPIQTGVGSRAELVSLLVTATKAFDPTTASLLLTGEQKGGTARAKDVLAAFYYGGAALGPTSGEKAFLAKAVSFRWACMKRFC